MSDSDHERRQHVRVPAELLPSLTARLSGGAPVRLLDVSRRGVRLETPMRMRPGQTVCIRFVAADATVSLTAAVVRASVANVHAAGVAYETALSLAGDLLLCERLLESVTQADAGPTAAGPAGVFDSVVDYTVLVDAPSESTSVVDDMRVNAW